MHCIHGIKCTIYDMSSTVYHITFTICVTSHNACISDITKSMFITYPLYMASQTVITTQPLCLISHPVYLCHHIKCTSYIKPSACMTSQPLYIWQHMQYIWKHIHSLWHHNSLFMTWSPLYLTSCSLYLCHHTHTTDDITATLSMISRPVYMWHPILYI